MLLFKIYKELTKSKNTSAGGNTMKTEYALAECWWNCKLFPPVQNTFWNLLKKY